MPTNGELNLDVFLAPIEIERLAHEWQGMVAIARQVMQPFTRNTKES